MGQPHERVAVVTGGSRGLGRAMVLALAGLGVRTVAAAHIADDEADLQQAAAEAGVASHLAFKVADLRTTEGCDSTVAFARQYTGHIDILINNAGLTLTFVAPDLFRRSSPRRFFESSDEVIRGIYETNCMAPEMMAARIAPAMVKRGWGRIINVTTMLPTMQRLGFCPYGASKAALEMSSMVWARELQETGVTVNVLNPGGGANTLGIAEEVRRASARGEIDRLVEPEDMAPPLRWLVSAQADHVTGMRIDAKDWDASKPAGEAASQCMRPCGLQTLPATKG